MMSSTTIERFIPIGPTSLSSDAPGWHGTPKTTTTTTTTTLRSTKLQPTPSSSASSSPGPTCWKCKGTGILKQKQPKTIITTPAPTAYPPATTTPPPPSSPTTSRTPPDATDRKNHRRRPTIERKCPVCTGRGTLPPKKPTSSSPDDKSPMITRRRRAYPGWTDSGPTAHAVRQCREFIRRYHDDVPSSQRRHPLYLLHRADGRYDGSSNDDDDENEAGVSTRHGVASEEYPWMPLHPGEQLCNLVGNWRILQKVKCHRWTTDDLVTACVARRELSKMDVRGCFNYLDLGCGNGSVLQMVLWSLVDRRGGGVRAVGVEARGEAVGLARRSLAFNVGTSKIDDGETTDGNGGGVSVEVIHDDFRRLEQLPDDDDDDDDDGDALRRIKRRKYHLVTGTPPYFRVDFTTTTTTLSSSSSSSSSSCDDDTSNDNHHDTTNNNTVVTTTTTSAVINQGGMPTSLQSAPARCEFRGGIEAYCRAAAKLLSDDDDDGGGVFVVCENTLNRSRVYEGATVAGLVVETIQPVKGKKGGCCLFDVFVMVKKRWTTCRDEMMTMMMDDNKRSDEMRGTTTAVVLEELCVRDEGGQWTMEYGELLEQMSIPAKYDVMNNNKCDARDD